MSDPLSTVYCTDEDIAVRAGGDYILLCPKWQKRAQGADGAITAGSWMLGSATASFVAGGVGTGGVVWLRKPAAAFGGNGELFGVDAADATTATLRRIGEASGVGQPPVSANTTSIEYVVLTLAPQIESASFELNRQYRIDPAWPGRTPTDLYDLRDLRQACVLWVLVQRLASEVQDRSDASWGHKLSNYRRELELVLARLQVRWSQDEQRPSTTFFSTRIVR